MVMRVFNPNDYSVEKALERKKQRIKANRMRGETLEQALRRSERSDVICPITGDNDLLDTAENIYACDKCFRKFKSYEAVIAYPKQVMGMHGEKCAFCGKSLFYVDTAKGKHSWWIAQMPISLRSMWHVLGKKKKPLRIDGDLLFY